MFNSIAGQGGFVKQRIPHLFDETPASFDASACLRPSGFSSADGFTNVPKAPVKFAFGTFIVVAGFIRSRRRFYRA
jgi:hypothetical protein